MQILQWLFKRASEQERDGNTSSSPTKREAISDKNDKGNDTVVHKRHRAYQRTKRNKGTKFGCNSLKLFAFICGKDIPKACFYRTLNLSSLRNLNRRRDFVHSVKMKREELSGGVGTTKEADSAAHVGKKVLPITEASLTTSTEKNDHRGTTDTKDQNKGNKKKAISRMKELLRWAAATKTEKRGKFNGPKVLQFRRHGTIKAAPDDEQLSSESPKISFAWDVESCSTISSVYSSAISTAAFLFENGQPQIAHSSIHIPPRESGHTTCRNGNWITTDSEFVVLEL